MEARRLAPSVAAVGGGEDAAAGEQVAVRFVAEVEVVDGLGGLDGLARPRAPAVLRVDDEAAVARRPSALRVGEVDGVQILAGLAPALGGPTRHHVVGRRRGGRPGDSRPHAARRQRHERRRQHSAAHNLSVSHPSHHGFILYTKPRGRDKGKSARMKAKAEGGRSPARLESSDSRQHAFILPPSAFILSTSRSRGRRGP